MLAAQQIVNKLLETAPEPDFDPQRYIDELPPAHHFERWVLTAEQAERGLAALRSDDELIATVTYEENGEQLESSVIVYRNGEVSNRFDDGTRGVPGWLIQMADEEETLYDPSVHEFTDLWRDVVVDSEGKFVAWKKHE